MWKFSCDDGGGDDASVASWACGMFHRQAASWWGPRRSDAHVPVDRRVYNLNVNNAREDTVGQGNREVGMMGIGT